MPIEDFDIDKNRRGKGCGTCEGKGDSIAMAARQLPMVTNNGSGNANFMGYGCGELFRSGQGHIAGIGCGNGSGSGKGTGLCRFYLPVSDERYVELPSLSPSKSTTPKRRQFTE